MTEQKIAGKWTREKLAALSPRDRYKLRESTSKTKLIDAVTRAFFVQAIDESGPIFDSSAITADDPVTLAMEEIIDSKDGRAACLQATEDGQPALAGVEHMIVREVGTLYGQKYMATQWAGYIVGTLMKSLDYEQIGQKAMPAGSVAKTAAVWARKKRL